MKPIVTPTLSYLQNSEKILPMLLIETPTTLGRTYQGYKHGGSQEGRERICEESLAAVVWLFGMSAFNKIGDFIGEKILGLKDLGVDVGKDSLRNPFGYVKDKKGITAAFKFSKIAFSTVLSVAAMGIAVPKIKQAMTNAIRMNAGLDPIPGKDGEEYKPGLADKIMSFIIKPKKKEQKPFINKIDMANFVDSAKKQNKGDISFKGGVDFLLFATHNLENNTAWRLLSSDTGMLAGRVLNSRNKKEGIEYAFRDSVSSFAYIFAAPLFSNLVRFATDTPNVHPKGADCMAEYLSKIVKDEGGFVRPDFFTSKIKTNEELKEAIKGLKFEKNKTIWLEDFNSQTNGKFKDRALLMSKLQPEYITQDGAKRAILSEKQAMDIMSESYISDPEFLKKAISEVTNGKSDDVKSFVSRRRLEKIRDSFDKYAKNLEKYANKKGKNIDSELISKYTKSLNRKNLLIHMTGIAFAVSLLAYFIPKLQYIVSDKLTGTKGYNLGTENNEKE